MRIIIIVLIAAIGVTGCAESKFILAPESRLPLWFTIPEGETPQDYTVSLTYYIWPSGREAVLELKKKDSWWVTKKVKGSQRGLSPLVLKNSTDGRYPSYEVITADGVTDIVEHRRMEPVFYTVDNPDVWSELGVQRK